MYALLCLAASKPQIKSINSNCIFMVKIWIVQQIFTAHHIIKNWLLVLSLSFLWIYIYINYSRYQIKNVSFILDFT